MQTVCPASDVAHARSPYPAAPGPQVESRTVVAAGALVPPGTVIPSGQVWAGSPAKFIRNLVEGEHSCAPVCHGYLRCLIQLGIVGFTCVRAAARPPSASAAQWRGSRLLECRSCGQSRQAGVPSQCTACGWQDEPASLSSRHNLEPHMPSTPLQMRRRSWRSLLTPPRSWRRCMLRRMRKALTR